VSARAGTTSIRPLERIDDSGHDECRDRAADDENQRDPEEVVVIESRRDRACEHDPEGGADTPGSRWHYRGVDVDGRFTDNVHVKHRRKTIEGVRTTVVHDVVLKHGKPREVTNDWYAQDRHGNVWYFGENTKELDRHGHVTSREGSFKAGRDGARPGVLFPGHPRVGLKARQEYYKGHAEDHFKILDRNARVSVPYVSSHHAVKTKEWTPLEPGIVEHKYYVRGVGDVKEVTVKGPKERLRLVSFHRG
jgi:hypothetical protein